MTCPPGECDYESVTPDFDGHDVLDHIRQLSDAQREGMLCWLSGYVPAAVHAALMGVRPLA